MKSLRKTWSTLSIGALFAALIGGIFVSPQQASALAGWSYVRSDAFSHYACKTAVSSPYGPLWKIKTLSIDYNNSGSQQGIGVYANVNRNGQIVNSATSSSWWNGMVVTDSMYASQLFDDRVYIQGAYYGPANLGLSVPAHSLVNCN